jgi:hypothetical protein
LVSELRDLLEYYLSNDLVVGLALLSRWERSRLAILRRLTVHGWTERVDVDAAAKLAKLLNSDWLACWETKHEAYRLLAVVAPGLSLDEVSTVCNLALGRYSSATNESEQYEAYNLLVWLDRHVPVRGAVTTAIDGILAAHPEWRPREFPDLDRWSRVGSGFDDGEQVEVDAQLLHQAVVDDSESAAANILAQFAGLHDGPKLWSVSSEVRSAAEAYPSDGLALLDLLGSTEGPDATMARRAILEGLSRTTLPIELVDRLLTELAKLVHHEEHRDAIASNLEKHSGASSGSPDFAMSPAAGALAAALWRQWSNCADEMAAESPDALFDAINHWTGKLAMFWMHRISSTWKAHGEAWQGLPSDARAALEKMIGGSEPCHRHASVVLASQLQFLFAADEVWAVDQVMPLLVWSTDGAKGNWNGFLTWGRWSNRLLEKGLMGLYLAAVPHLTAFDDKDRERFVQHLADIALLGGASVPVDGWIVRFQAEAPLSDVVGWTRAIGWTLKDLEPQQVGGLWEQVLRRHMTSRASGLPTALGTEEASALAGWTVYLGEHFEEAVRLVSTMPSRLEEHSNLLHDLKASGLPERCPQAVAKLVAQLLKGSPLTTGYLCYYVEPIAKTVKDSVPPELYRSLVEAALPMCPGAASW